MGKAIEMESRLGVEEAGGVEEWRVTANEHRLFKGAVMKFLKLGAQLWQYMKTAPLNCTFKKGKFYSM